MSMNELINALDKSLKKDFEVARNVHFNPNVKGQGYEKILKEFFEKYLEGVFTLNSRAALIDDEHRVFQLFKPGENEFDVVATYKASFPSKVFSHQGITFISYDSCAFLVEVAQTLTKSQIEDDMRKLSKLSNLGDRGGFGAYVGGPHNLQYPPRVLFYFERSISSETLNHILDQYRKAWELIIIFNDNLLLINSVLPIVTKKPPKGPFVIIKKNALLWLFHSLAELLPYPFIVDAFQPFRKVLFSRIRRPNNVID